MRALVKEATDVRWLFVTAQGLREAHGVLDYSDDDYPNSYPLVGVRIVD